MTEPKAPLTIWIEGNSLYFTGEGGQKHVVKSKPIKEHYLEVNNSVYPHSGQEKTSKSLP